MLHKLFNQPQEVRASVVKLSNQLGVNPETLFNDIPDEYKNSPEVLLNSLNNFSTFQNQDKIDPSSIELSPDELYLKDLNNQPQEIQDYFNRRASNHERLSGQEIFDKVQDHLKDNPEELLDYMAEHYGDKYGMEVSHIISKKNNPQLSGDPDNVVLESTEEHLNQSRGSSDMTDHEINNAIEHSKQRALEIEYQYSDENDFIQVSNYTSDFEQVKDLALINQYEGLSDSILRSLQSIADTLGISLSYALVKVYLPRIIALIRYIANNRKELEQNSYSRKKLVQNYIMPLIQENDVDLVGSAFIVGLALTCIPGIKELLLAHGLTSLCKLALPHIEKFILDLEKRYPTIAKCLHWVVSRGKGLINTLHTVLAQLWKFVEQAANTGWKMINEGIAIAQDCLSSIFNWGWEKISSLFRESTQSQYA